MKTSRIVLCLFVLFLTVVTVSAESSTISSVSPTVGYTDSATTLTITGTDFNSTSVSVKLTKSDAANITDIPITSHTATSIVCTVPSLAKGAWSIVVVNQDGSEVKKVDAFTVREAITLSSVTPASGRKNNASVKISVVGEGLSYITSMYLYNADHSNISASSVSAISATRVNGTFSFVNKDIDTYEICVVDSFSTKQCGLSFKITSDATGSIELSSSPSGATVYLDGVSKGTTPITLSDLDVGTYKVMIKKSGYNDWNRAVKVTNGDTASFTANLETTTTATTATPTTAPTTVPTSIKVTRKATTATATPWPSNTPTPASPVDVLVIVGGVGLALLAVRRH